MARGDGPTRGRAYAERYEDSVEYWWEPLPTSPYRAFALEEGRALVLDGVDLGLETVPELELVDLADTWASYVETGTLNLRWEPSANPTTHVELEESWASRTAYFRCVLVDDGEARIVFPGAAPSEAYPTFTFFSRVQAGSVVVRDHELVVTSQFYLTHSGPDD